MKPLNRILALLLLPGVAMVCHAGVEKAQLAHIERSVVELVHLQTAGLPGKVSFTLGAIDAKLNLAACPTLEAFVPTGARLWGNTNVGVRCNVGTPWTIYVPVAVKIIAGVVVAARPLVQGRSIEVGDLAIQDADLGLLPAAVITDTNQAIGRVVTNGVAAGQPLRKDLLRSPQVIQSGQSVTLRVQGSGFEVSAAGKAVSNAVDGQVAQVRLPSGHTVSGIARLGSIVEVDQ